MDSLLLTNLNIALGPMRGLHLANMCLAQEEHTHPRLSDTAADRIRQLSVQKRLVERQSFTVGASALRELTAQRILIHADPHRGKLKRNIKDGIIYDNISVERPIIVVGSSAVVDLAALQLSADLLEEDRTVFLRRGVFALL